MNLSYHWFHGEEDSAALNKKNKSVVQNVHDLHELTRQLRSNGDAGTLEQFRRHLRCTVRCSHLLTVRERSEARIPIIGMAVLIPLYSLSKRTGHVEDVVVHQSHRGNGIGRLVMEQVIWLAREELGLKSLMLTSDPQKPNRAAARKLYPTLGFTETHPGEFVLALR